MDTTFLDARGLNCPLPLLKTRQALRGLAPGALLEVAATDAGSARDIPEYLRQSPHELVRRQDDDREYRFLIRRGEEGQGPERGTLMLDVFKGWFNTWFSDDEAVYLLVVLLAGFAVVVLFGGMLAPVLTALVLAYLMQGLVTQLNRLGLPPGLSVNLVFLLFLAALTMVLVVVLPMVWRQTVLLVRDQLPYIVHNAETWLRALPERYPEMVSMEQVNTLVNITQREMAQFGQSVLTLSLSSIPNLLDILVFLVLVPVLVFFFLKDRRLLVGWVLGFLPQRRRILSHVWDEMDQQIANYVRGKAVEILLVGATTFLAFLFLGLNYTVLLAVLVGFSVLIPYIGATIVTLPVAAVAYLQFGWSGDFALVMVVYGVIQFIDGNILVPLLFSEAVNLHPVAIITAILFFGGVWGLWGVFFAIPLATLLKAVINAWPRRPLPAEPVG